MWLVPLRFRPGRRTYRGRSGRFRGGRERPPFGLPGSAVRRVLMRVAHTLSRGVLPVFTIGDVTI